MLTVLTFLVFYLTKGLPFPFPKGPMLDQIFWVENPVPACGAHNSNNSFIYCNGSLLMAVNYHQLFNDSKTFVDMPMKHDPEYVLTKFNEEFGNTFIENINKTQLKLFVDQYFSPPGSEMLPCTPHDWNPQPSKLVSISDPKLREWAMKLNAIWVTLCRRVDPAIAKDSARHSLIYLPHNFIIPGGRFREFYYWDAYWIIKGLIACEMYNTTKAMIENLGSLVERYGFVPNGGRVYYLQRSQPPMLAGMVYEYYEVTKDKNFVRKMLPILEKEVLFWQTKRMVNVTVKGTTYMVYRYSANSNMPRPESYAVDLKKAQSVADKALFWKDIASAGESGWDFSTRWFEDSKTIYTIETQNVLPVDLNAFICWTYDILEYLFERTHDQVKSEYYRELRAHFRNTVHKVFYNHTAGTWFDFNLRTGSHNTRFYPSITVPLFTGCYNSLNQGKSEKLFYLMKYLGVFEYPGGIPTSMVTDSEEQWDFPNGFSPLNHMIVEGLRKSQNAQMQDAAFRLAEKWLTGNYKVWTETNHMWEKIHLVNVTLTLFGLPLRHHIVTGARSRQTVELAMTCLDNSADLQPKMIFRTIVSDETQRILVLIGAVEELSDDDDCAASQVIHRRQQKDTKKKRKNAHTRTRASLSKAMTILSTPLVPSITSSATTLDQVPAASTMFRMDSDGRTVQCLIS